MKKKKFRSAAGSAAGNMRECRQNHKDSKNAGEAGKTEKTRMHGGIALILAAVGLGLGLIGGSYAAYNNQAFQRGVVRNVDSEELRFTSNLMKSYVVTGAENHYETFLYPFPETTKEEDSLTIPLKIANHLMTNDNLVSEKDITFDLTIRLTGRQEGFVYTLTGGATGGEQVFSFGEDGVLTIPGITLTGRKPNLVSYELGITGKDLNQLTITAEAKASGASAASFGSRILAAYICPCVNSQANPFSYSGQFLNQNVGTPADYYGYNYEVSISNGRAYVTLNWNPEYLMIDRYFLEKLSTRPHDGLSNAYEYNKDAGSLSFYMDQTLGEDDYVVLFYPLEGKRSELIDAAGGSWDGMTQMITVSAVEIDTSQN